MLGPAVNRQPDFRRGFVRQSNAEKNNSVGGLAGWLLARANCLGWVGLAGWLASWLAVWQAGWQNGCLLASCLADCLADWLAGSLLAGWLHERRLLALTQYLPQIRRLNVTTFFYPRLF